MLVLWFQCRLILWYYPLGDCKWMEMFPFYLFSSCVEWCGVKFSQIGFIGSNFMAAVSAGAREVECLHILTGLEKLHLGGEWRAVSGESGPADHVEGWPVSNKSQCPALHPRIWTVTAVTKCDLCDRNTVSPVILTVAGGARSLSGEVSWPELERE